jgi:hypothetical protein
MANGRRIFVRDDDVGDLTPELQRFFKLFYDREIPVSYQIIPENLTAKCAEFLLAARKKRPDLVEFGQHGLRHQMMVRGKLEFYEFGPERSFDQQAADIAEGRALLRKHLGDAPVPVFTPPRHRYNRDTLKALSGQDFSIFSASSYLKPHHRLAYGLGRALGLSSVGARGVPYHGRRRPDGGLFELSVAVTADDGSAPLGSARAILSDLAQATADEPMAGLMFHHQVYRDSAREAQLNELVDGLAAMSGVSFHTMNDLRIGVCGEGVAA